MIDYEQLVDVKIATQTFKYYKDKGYGDFSRGDIIKVKIKDLSRGCKSLIPITCDICGKQFKRKYCDHIKHSKHTDACYECKGKKMGLTKMIQHQDDKYEKVIKMCNKKGYKLITPKEEIRYGTKIEYSCPKHGCQNSSYDNFVNGHGCYKCGIESATSKSRRNTKDLIEAIEGINNNKLLNPNDYINAHKENLRILCGTCNEREFSTSYHNYFRGVNRCKFCSRSKSKNEYKICKILDSYNVEYESDKSFKGCKDKGALFFDFYLPDYNLCIEFDGEQHYNSNFFITRGYDDPQKAFEEYKRRDEIKTKYCKDNNINLLRIPYWEENRLEEIIINEINLFK